MIEQVELVLESRSDMEGCLTISSLITIDRDGEREDHQDLVGKEFFGDETGQEAVSPEQEAVSFVAKKFKINEDIIEVDIEYISRGD